MRIAWIEVYIRPYRDADFFQWTQIGQKFRVNSRMEAVDRARESGYVLGHWCRVVVTG